MSASAFRRRPGAIDPLRTGQMMLRRLLDEHAGLLQQVTQLRASQPRSQYDDVTGLGTRRTFDTRVRQELSRVEHNPSCTGALLLMDVDDLDVMEGRHGSAVADRAVRWVAKVLKECLRVSDVACRGAGDQFMAIVCDTDSFGAGEVVARLRGEIARASGYRWSPASLSCGTAAWPVDALTTSALMAIASARLLEDRRRRQEQQRPHLVLLP
jgi:diguanylate cyclase (GGDEF)-like protein